MITVKVKLFATLRHLRPGLGIGEAFSVEVPLGATVGSLVGELELPPDQVKIVFVNALFSAWDRVLCDGDEVGIFPPVGGG